MLFAIMTPAMMVFLGVLGVLVFGRRLPELGRTLGRTLVEFKKGAGGVEDTI